jgi:hypothetical protein
MNIYASYNVLTSQANDKSQKIPQLCFIWLIPFIGAAITNHLLNDPYRKPKESTSGREMDYEEAWNYSHNEPPSSETSSTD